MNLLKSIIILRYQHQVLAKISSMPIIDLTLQRKDIFIKASKVKEGPWQAFIWMILQVNIQYKFYIMLIIHFKCVIILNAKHTEKAAKTTNYFSYFFTRLILEQSIRKLAPYLLIAVLIHLVAIYLGCVIITVTPNIWEIFLLWPMNNF